LDIFHILIERFSRIEDFNQRAIEETFKDLSILKGTKLAKLAQPVRVSLTGTTVSPGIYEVIEVLGKKRIINRLNKAIEFIRDKV
jgi:glutamyl-tRNA synthetase